MEEVLLRLAKAVDEKRYGKYRGFVDDNEDPERRARLKLRVPTLLGDGVTDWALPCLPFGGLPDQGWFAVPDKDAQVWVEFEEGDMQRPVWTGTFWQKQDDVPAEAALEKPTVRAFKTPSGHILELSDEEDKETLRLSHATNAELAIDENGTLVLRDAAGGSLTLDADAKEVVVKDENGNTLTMSSSGTIVEDKNGNKIEMTASGLTVKGQQVLVDGGTVMLAGQGGEPIIKGTSFLALFATHTHPTAMGPSGPPVPQGEMSSLSSKVLTS